MRHLTILASLAISACGVGASGGDTIGIGKKTDDCPVGAVSEAELTDSTARASEELGLPIGLANRTCQRPGVDCEPLRDDQGELAKATLASVREELGRYPRSFLKAHGPKQIWLVADLKSEGVKWEAGGVAVNQVIYLNVRVACSPIGRALVVQHEFFHVLDRQLFVNAAWNNAWTAMNPSGFRYGGDYNKVEGYELHETQGFATSYAVTNIMEDRAETYTYRVVEAARPLMDAWIKNDPLLAKKDSMLQYWVRNAWPEVGPL